MVKSLVKRVKAIGERVIELFNREDNSGSYMRFYINAPVNINLGRNVFMNGTKQFDHGSPFTFNAETGTFGCNKTGTYTWRFSTMLYLGSPVESRNKLLLNNGSGVVAVKLTEYDTKFPRSFEYTVTLPAIQNEVWALGFVTEDGDSIVYTSGPDQTFGCPNTTLEIIGI